MNINLLHRIKFFSNNARKDLFDSYQNILGFAPRNIEYYQLAVRHRSKPLKTSDKFLLNNERLEFLGDAVLNAIVSAILYNKYPQEQEGFLTNIRSNIVKRDTLNQLCMEIELDKLIVASKNMNLERKQNFNILGNTLEAFVGAIYLDRGFEKCKCFVEDRLFSRFAEAMALTNINDNPKSQLIEWCQRYHFRFDFVLLDEILIGNNLHNFTTQIEIQGIIVGVGNGTNKKESQQKASENALEAIGNNPNLLGKIQLGQSSEHQL